MKTYEPDWEKYAAAARQAAAEGIVLVRNEGRALPLRPGERLSVFGRIQSHYYKSGTGSGGSVRAPYVTGILDALERDGSVVLNRKLLQTYQEWEKRHPFEEGTGWAGEPWCQEEMPISEALAAEAAAQSDAALVMLGRTAGEDKDNKAEKGSFLLTDVEEDMLQKVCRAFSRVVVALNTGNIMDMKWVDQYKPQAVLYAWQGGQEGGNALTDVLTGKVNPCGRLPDTIAADIADYPSTANFGDPKKAVYQEDIYVGYRYFETFAPQKVLYPFGFGLSYTEFEQKLLSASFADESVRLSAEISNRGDLAGKDVVQLYVKKPNGSLGQPARVLVEFGKTKLLAPGEKQVLSFAIPLEQLASYDDSGVTGHPYAWVAEEGRYTVFMGENVREAKEVFAFDLPETRVVMQCVQALAPVEEFMRLKNDGYGIPVWEKAPLRTYDLAGRIAAGAPGTEDYPAYTQDRGYRLWDVADGKVSMEEFLAQLSDEDLSHMAKGEGMCSPKVTPGTAGAIGGLTKKLQDFGIPVICCSDGPAGIRMESEAKAFSLPNGACLAGTFDRELNRQLFAWEGMELRYHNIDTLLGPGLNLHRNPLNGRNFEYFSEDPFLTGQIAASQLAGMHSFGVTGTVKHFAGNNQETGRFTLNSVVSERALRELYLKGFEIAVKEGGAFCVMSTYGAINGIWTAGNYDLLTEVLRKEWGFRGIVMSDWWAAANDEGGEPVRGGNLHAMVRAQNDAFMVVEDTVTFQDDILSSLKEGRILRGELMRNAGNICGAALRFPCMERMREQPAQTDGGKSAE